jgi:hypothetical protein
MNSDSETTSKNRRQTTDVVRSSYNEWGYFQTRDLILNLEETVVAASEDQCEPTAPRLKRSSRYSTPGCLTPGSSTYAFPPPYQCMGWANGDSRSEEPWDHPAPHPDTYAISPTPPYSPSPQTLPSYIYDVPRSLSLTGTSGSTVSDAKNSSNVVTREDGDPNRDGPKTPSIRYFTYIGYSRLLP